MCPLCVCVKMPCVSLFLTAATESLCSFSISVHLRLSVLCDPQTHNQYLLVGCVTRSRFEETTWAGPLTDVCPVCRLNRHLLDNQIFADSLKAHTDLDLTASLPSELEFIFCLYSYLRSDKIANRFRCAVHQCFPFLIINLFVYIF